ncbi:MAG: hypothetical protein KDA47_23840, partial [Planctomycetales bacterium]|nr:hypothetical protein [Planctomycetales bacterium]
MWGAEFPDLLITEATAFHDRRVKDEASDNGDMKRRADGDNDLDQYRLPEGSLFLEFYCPRTRYRNNPILPRELYNIYNNGTAGDPTDDIALLDVGRLAPPDGAGRRYPVWRTGVTAPHTGANPNIAITTRRNNRPDTITFQPQPDPLDLTSGSVPQIPLERFVWFTNQNPATNAFPNASATYYCRQFDSPDGATIGVQAGGYLVVGPRNTTYMGSRNVVPAPAVPTFSPSPQKIELSSTNPGGPIVYTRPSGAVQTPALGQIQRATTIVAAANPPSDWTNVANTAPNGIGVSVSEPIPTAANYYSEPNYRLFGPGTPMDSWELTPGSGMTAFPDRPFDERNNMPLENRTETGTRENFVTVFLQRLADPMRPHHVVNNPYITVDWSPVDLTVFSGEEDVDRQIMNMTTMMMEWIDPSDEDPFTNGPQEEFDTRERNGNNNRQLWAQAWDAPSQDLVAATDAYFNRRLDNTFGYLNDAFGTRRGPTMAGDVYAGDPQINSVNPGESNTFPWLAWNDRPYANALELLLVPASAPNRLLHEFGMSSGSGQSVFHNPDT